MITTFDLFNGCNSTVGRGKYRSGVEACTTYVERVFFEQ